MGQGHFRAKKAPRQLARKDGPVLLHQADKKVLIKRFGWDI